MIQNLEDIRLQAKKFADDRNWAQFHSPKNLSMALSVEAAELMEHFQWLNESESASPNAAKVATIAEEVADVQIYLVMLADKLGIDILTAVSEKIKKNEKRYPAHRVFGSARKHSEYQENP